MEGTNSYEIYVFLLGFHMCWWNFDLVFVYLVASWNKLSRMYRLSPKSAKILFLAKRKRSFSVWGVLQQVYVYIMFLVVGMCALFRVKIPVKESVLFCIGVFFLFQLLMTIDTLFFDNACMKD